MGAISPALRRRTATVVQHSGGATLYRFPMPDLKHARLALQMLPRAKGLSAAEKARIKERAYRMLGKNRFARKLIERA